MKVLGISRIQWATISGTVPSLIGRMSLIVCAAGYGDAGLKPSACVVANEWPNEGVGASYSTMFHCKQGEVGNAPQAKSC